MEACSEPGKFNFYRAQAKFIKDFFLDPTGGIEASLKASYEELVERRKAGNGPGTEPPRPYMERDSESGTDELAD